MVGHICRRGSRRKLELDGGHYRAGGFLGGCVLRFCRLVFGVLFFGVLLASGASAGPLDEAAALNAQVGELYHAGKYSQAIEITKKVLAILEKALGPEHLAFELPHALAAFGNAEAFQECTRAMLNLYNRRARADGFRAYMKEHQARSRARRQGHV